MPRRRRAGGVPVAWFRPGDVAARLPGGKVGGPLLRRGTSSAAQLCLSVRLRQRVTKGAGSRRRNLTMAFKLLEMVQQRWRRLNASELLPLVRAGVPFRNGIRVER